MVGWCRIGSATPVPRCSLHNLLIYRDPGHLAKEADGRGILGGQTLGHWGICIIYNIYIYICPLIYIYSDFSIRDGVVIEAFFRW